MSILDILTDKIVRGVFPQIEREKYHKSPGLNPSTIVYRRKSALACKHAYEEQWEDTDAKLFGRCCHSLLFEADRFQEDWAIWPSDKRRYGREWDAFKAENAGKEIIKDGDQQYGFKLALKAVTTALKHKRLRELVAEGVPELAVFTEEHGLQCRGRLDWIDTAGGNIVDAKFTTDVDPKVFGRSANTFGYHIKMACYREWFRRESGKEVNGVYLLTIETKPPFDVAVVQIPEWQLEDGWAQARELIRLIAGNVKANAWPGVDEGNPSILLDLPTWALMETNGIEGAEEIEV